MPVSTPVAVGLSPRLRGNPIELDKGTGAGRSIPAPAGEPASTPTTKRNGKVYPRACGGTIRARISSWARIGLSPRLRGTPPSSRNTNGRRSLSPRLRGNRAGVQLLRLAFRCIPAPAGEPGFQDGGRSLGGVYPRACGGTILPPVMDSAPQVYPRACGGTPYLGPEVAAVGGLSPRLRGNRAGVQLLRLAFRCIPAPAGEPDHDVPS